MNAPESTQTTSADAAGAPVRPLLDRAISMRGDDVDDDYWKPTEGNAKRALCQLRALAQMRPDGLWVGD